MDMLFGLAGNLGWWYVGIALILTHLTIASVTLYLHRSKTHGSVEFHPFIQHFFRFCLWLTTGMKTRDWVKVHRKHHATCETADDPHSPQHYGIWKLLSGGVDLYKKAVASPGIESYVSNELSTGLPDDWLECNVYSKYPWLGLVILAILQIIILGLPGLIIFGIQAYWIPILAAGVINGIGHYWGYRNFETPDESRNIFPWGILIGGEELHNNHHAYQTSPKLSSKWWECDIGWLYILILELFGLATLDHKKVTRVPLSISGVPPLNKEELKQLFVKHSAFIGAEFYKIPRPVCILEGLGDLYDFFAQCLKKPNAVSAFELEQWVGKVHQYDQSEDIRLLYFATWFRSLHEADEDVLKEL